MGNAGNKVTLRAVVPGRADRVLQASGLARRRCLRCGERLPQAWSLHFPWRTKRTTVGYRLDRGLGRLPGPSVGVSERLESMAVLSADRNNQPSAALSCTEAQHCGPPHRPFIYLRRPSECLHGAPSPFLHVGIRRIRCVSSKHMPHLKLTTLCLYMQQSISLRPNIDRSGLRSWVATEAGFDPSAVIFRKDLCRPGPLRTAWFWGSMWTLFIETLRDPLPPHLTVGSSS